jgi:hypothetical protein
MTGTESAGQRRRGAQPSLAYPRAIAVIAMLLVLAAGCAGRATPTADPFNFPKATPRPGGEPEPSVAIPTPEPYVTSGIPRCRGLQELPSPLKFDWPNIDEALEKLEDYNWGYFGCAMPQVELQAFVRQNMPKPPYLWEEVNGAEHQGGAVLLFYHRVFITWIYIWMLPQNDARLSYLVIAKGNPGMAQTWECNLRRPPTLVWLELNSMVPGLGRLAAAGG